MLSFEKIGETIRTIRESQKLSQQSVVDFMKEKGINISRETLSKIENGNRNISVVEINAFAQIFNVSTDVFFEDDEEDESLVTLFRKKKELNDEQEEYLFELQTMAKVLIGQGKLHKGELKPRNITPSWKGDV